MEKLRFSLLSNIIRHMRGTELQSAASRLSIWITHRLNSDPGSWDLLCKWLGISEYLPGNLPLVTRAPDLDTRFRRGVVDPLGLDWGWVVRGLHLTCRNSFFFCEKNLKLNSEGDLDYRELARALRPWVISTVIRAIWIPFFYVHVWKVFSPNGRRLASWMEYSSGILQRLMEATLAFIFYLTFFGNKCLANALWQRLLRIYSLFLLLLIFTSLIIIT